MYVVTQFAWLHNIVEPLALQTFWIVFADLCTSSVDDPNDLQTLMDALRASISNQEIQRFSIDRQELWEDSVATFKSPKFNEIMHQRVKFQGEAGIDAGGLSREYGTILRKELFSAQACLFEGQDTTKLPIYNINGIQSNLYYLAGKMVAYLIVHFDIGVPLLSPVFYNYIVNQDVARASEHCSVDDIPDFDIKKWINEVYAECILYLDAIGHTCLYVLYPFVTLDQQFQNSRRIVSVNNGHRDDGFAD